MAETFELTTAQKLEAIINKYFTEESIKNLTNYQNLDFHKVIQIRGIPNRENPFFDKVPCECTRNIKQYAELKDIPIKKYILNGDYRLGYVLASRLVNGYDIYKCNFKTFVEMVVMDLQDKLGTNKQLMGSLRAKVTEFEASAGYRLEIEATVGICPDDVYYAHEKTPSQIVEELMK